MTQKTLNGLRKARDLLAGGWCQGTLARDAEGIACVKGEHDPASYCLNGALSYAWDELFFDLEAARDMITRAGHHLGHDMLALLDDSERRQIELTNTPALAARWALEEWNDKSERTQEEVLAVLDKAIELKGKETI